ncbi:MAG: hypothetical protein AAGU11_04385 [Syntrophobacteraceae bacterium]
MDQNSCVSVIDRKSESLEHRYNPENDTIPGAPSVTWADNQLLDLIKYLAGKVDYLQKQIDELKAHK